MLIHSLQQAILFLPLSLGLLLSYRITQLTDLTVESSFLTGAAIFATLLPHMPLSCALILGVVSGCITGGFAAWMQRNDRMDSLMAGIISVFMFLSVNLLVMGRPHLALDMHVPVWVNAAVVVGLMVGLYALLSSRYGLKLKAFGDNPKLFQELLGKREAYRLLGLCVSNVLAAVAGLLTALNQGYVDIYMSQGVALLGIGTVVVSEAITGRKTASMAWQMGVCSLTVWLYFLLSHAMLTMGMNTVYLRLLIGGILVVMLRRKPV